MSFADPRRRQFLQRIAEDTIGAIRAGHYRVRDHVYDLHTEASIHGTHYYPPNHPSLSNWSIDIPQALHAQTWFCIHEISTLDGAFLLSNTLRNNDHSNKIGVLNFASATKPGGGFWNGVQAQEESIARSSTLYPTLVARESRKFYDLHNVERNPYYTDAMIYSPAVEIFRDDTGRWTKPIVVDVLTSAAVNAKEVRRSTHGHSGAAEQTIELMMKERMARILCLFELKGARNLVLGSYGTGVFRNDVGLVARLWAELLAVRGARFENSFDRVIFAIIGRSTFVEFEDAFNRRLRRSSADLRRVR
jgi:uncharacterized protein (TIGR02452 family)